MRLQYKITLLIFGILLVIGIIGGGTMLNLQRQNAISQFELSGLTMATALLESLEQDMLDVDREHIQYEIDRMAQGPLINEVVILSANQRVFASAEHTEIGKTRNDEKIAAVLHSGEISTRTETQYGSTEFCVILPLVNHPECQTCHGSEQAILGVLEIGLEREVIDAQIRQQTMLMGLIGGLTFIGIGGVLSFILRSAVVNPLSELASSARRIARGDFSARSEVNRGDEAGMVSSAFNEMAERVEQHSLALEESKAALEDRVQERTEELQQMAVARGQLLEALISAQEEERRRVARELHDEAGQALSAIMLDLARAIEALPADNVEAREKLTESRSLASQTLAELRKLIYALRPEVLDQLGLVPALRSYVKSHLEAENIETKLSFSGLDDRLPPQLEIVLFRIIQEAINNIIRHAGATRVNIQVAAENSTIKAIIEDNGKGFDVEQALRSLESWGLRGMRERVAIVGGQVKISSGVGKVTRLQFDIPLKGE